MVYEELLAPDIFSKHVESYWSLKKEIHNGACFETELFVPTGTFNILFLDHPIHVLAPDRKKWKRILPGAYFLGQRKLPFSIYSTGSFTLNGLRFKPFAFAKVVKLPLITFTDELAPLNVPFKLDAQCEMLLKGVNGKTLYESSDSFDRLLIHLLGHELEIDDDLRSQLNLILDSKGSIKVQELLDTFKVSKVTLSKHFLNKVGLTPKQIAQTWRMNYFLHLRNLFPSDNLTQLCLRAGYFDQSHFIREFKTRLYLTPQKFLKEKNMLLMIENQNIGKRFTNQYDPR